MTSPAPLARSKALLDVLSQEQTKEIAGSPPRPPSAATTMKPARVRGRSQQRGRVVHGRSPPLRSQEGHRSSTQSTASLVG